MDGRVAASRAMWAFAGFFVFATPASANTEGYLGLIRSRDLSPFGFLRLDMRPSHAVSGETGTWAVETELGYQNTWALSPNVEQYLKTLPGRHELGPDDYAAIQNLPGENYLVDLELAELDVTFHYKFSSRFTAYATLSGVSYSGGFLDDSIESFHRAFGFSDFGRPAVKKNDTNILLNLKSAQYAAFEVPTQGGLLDPTVGFRYSKFKMPESWNLVVETAAKVPIQGRKTFISSGRTDFGLQLSLQKFGPRRAYYVSASGVYYDGSLSAPRTSAQVIPTLVFGVEQKLTQATHVLLQGYASKSIYSREVTDLDELLKNHYQYTVGLYHKTGLGVFAFSFTENLENLNNTPDIQLQLGYAYSPAFKQRPVAGR
jgi:hypothetical protein